MQKRELSQKNRRRRRAGVFVLLLALAAAGLFLANEMMPVSSAVSRAKMKSLYQEREISVKDKERVAALVEKLPYLSKAHVNFVLETDTLSAEYAVMQEIDAQDLKNCFYRNGAILFALIGDLQSVKFRGNDKTELYEVVYRRQEFEDRFGKKTTKDLASFEQFLKEADEIDFVRTDSLLPSVLQETLFKQNLVEVNRETTYQKTAVLHQNIVYQEPLLGISINAEEMANQFGFDLKQYYGKLLECYIYDTADGNQPASSQKKSFLSLVCEGKELYTMPLENDSQKQQIIKYIRLVTEQFLK